MFAKSKGEVKPQMNEESNNIARKPQSSAAPSIISSDVEIQGNVKTGAELQLDGKVVGDVDCGTLVMGTTGSLEGQIKADSVTIRGKVKGEIHARSVRLEASSEIEGDVYHETLSVEAGAKLSGRFARGMEPAKAAEKPAAKAEEKADTAPKAEKKFGPAGQKDTPSFLKSGAGS